MDPTIPRNPTGMTATATSQTQIDLSWECPCRQRRSGHHRLQNPIFRRRQPPDVEQPCGQHRQPGHNLRTTGLAPGTTHHYRVWALNGRSTSNPSSPATATTQTGDGTPSAPRNLMTQDQGRNQVNLLWSAPGYEGDSPVTSYGIDLSTDRGNSWTPLIANTGNTDTAYEHTDLTPGTTYYYRVRAITAADTTSAASAIAAATTTASQHPDQAQEPARDTRRQAGNTDVGRTRGRWRFPHHGYVLRVVTDPFRRAGSRGR